jgi:hypothetical protein
VTLQTLSRRRTRPLLALALLLGVVAAPARAAKEALTVPVILADYYAHAYWQAFEDRSFGYAYATGGVDALGWGVVLTTKKYSGMFLVNLAGVSKTAYPWVLLMGKPDRDEKRRAWRSVATHTGTLFWLKVWGKPGLTVHSWAPDPGTHGARLAWAF